MTEIEFAGYMVSDFKETNQWVQSSNIFETYDDAWKYMINNSVTEGYQIIEKIWLNDRDEVCKWETIYNTQ